MKHLYIQKTLVFLGLGLLQLTLLSQRPPDPLDPDAKEYELGQAQAVIPEDAPDPQAQEAPAAGPPEISCIEDIQTIAAPNSCGAVVTFDLNQITASDNTPVTAKSGTRGCGPEYHCTAK